MFPDIKGLPLKKWLLLDTVLEGCIGGQDRRINFASLEQQIQKFPFGICEGQQR